jgi:hypothetical protein
MPLCLIGLAYLMYRPAFMHDIETLLVSVDEAHGRTLWQCALLKQR